MQEMKHVQRKTKALIQTHPPNFKASAGWLDKFLRWHSLLYVDKHQSSRNCQPYWKKRYPLLQTSKHEFTNDLIINMDETPACFAMASNPTIWTGKESKKIIIRSTGAHKWRFMVTLTCTASGKMLQLFVTFKVKTQHISMKIKMREWDVIMTTQPKGLMDHNLMLTWIRKVLVKYTIGWHVLLVFLFDNFKGHLKYDISAWISLQSIHPWSIGRVHGGSSMHLHSLPDNGSED